MPGLQSLLNLIFRLGLGTLAEQLLAGEQLSLNHSANAPTGKTLFQATWTSQGTLLDIGALDFGGVSREERKQFFYMHLYYFQANIEKLRQASEALDDPGASKRLITYAVIPGGWKIRVYELRSVVPARCGEGVGSYVLYHLTWRG